MQFQKGIFFTPKNKHETSYIATGSYKKVHRRLKTHTSGFELTVQCFSCAISVNTVSKGSNMGFSLKSRPPSLAFSFNGGDPSTLCVTT